MSYNERISEFWICDGRRHLVPNDDEYLVEGVHTRKLLKNHVGNGSVIEIGCGDGRLCRDFSRDQYLGFDINPGIIVDARGKYRGYKFKISKPLQEYPQSDWVFMHTVLLHVDDDDIEEFLDYATRNTDNVIISEMMNRKFRKGDGSQRVPPVFNRSIRDYKDLFRDIGFRATARDAYYFKRYGHDLTYLVFERSKPI